jgi:glycine cleavage system T protein (aminomethyltransferase)
MTDELLKRTPLYPEHLALGGKMVPFAGYSLPVQFAGGIQEEHRAVREAAGLFDVSHMGGVEIEGPGALDLIQYLTVNDASRLAVGQSQYSLLCRESGGVIDDLLVYRTGDYAYLLIVNGARHAVDLEWMRSQAAGRSGVSLADHTDANALIALQGPRSREILTRAAQTRVDTIAPFHFDRGRVAGVDAFISRTGYTGEDGFELRVPADGAVAVWRRLLDEGRDSGIRPAGLGARDILRLEMGYALYGADLDEEHTPLEAGLAWVVKLGKGSFVGRDALAGQLEAGLSRRLSGIRLEEKGFPRPGYAVIAGAEEVGVVTSGTVSPALGYGIALAYLPSELARAGTGVAIRIRDRDLAASVVDLPFYHGGSRKR